MPPRKKSVAEQMLQPDPVLLNPEHYDDELTYIAEKSVVSSSPTPEFSNLIEKGDKIIKETVIDADDDAVKLYELEEKMRASDRSVTFVASNRGLHVMAEVIRRNHRNEIVRVSKIIEFRGGLATLSDPYEITAMRKHKSFGGDGSKDPDVAPNGGEPLFWENAFPKWKAEMIKQHEAQLRSTRWEPPEYDSLGATV